MAAYSRISVAVFKPGSPHHKRTSIAGRRIAAYVAPVMRPGQSIKTRIDPEIYRRPAPGGALHDKRWRSNHQAEMCLKPGWKPAAIIRLLLLNF